MQPFGTFTTLVIDHEFKNFQQQDDNRELFYTIEIFHVDFLFFGLVAYLFIFGTVK